MDKPIEQYVVQYLNANGVETYAEQPEDIPIDYVVIEKTSEYTEDFYTTAAISVRSTSSSMLKTIELAEKVKDLMRAMPDLNYVMDVELNTESNFTNTTLKKYRYQAVFIVRFMEE